MASRRFLLSALAICAAWAAGPAQAQQYPNRPIKLVVPLTAGGPGDVVARVIAQRMSEALGQPVVVDNVAGANMNIGADLVAKAAPDGYTMVMSATPMIVNPAMYAKMTYDPVKDFTPISLVASFPLVLVASAGLPFNNVSELIAYARQHPGELNYGSAGNGSTTHLAGVIFGGMSGTKLVHVPYRGINEAMTDVIGGRVQLSFAGAPIALPNAKAGKVKAIASTGARRSSSAPDLVTVAESGLPGFDVTSWYGIEAPRGTPAAIVNRWHAELVKIMKLPQTRERWLTLGADAVYNETPEEFDKMKREESAKWAKAVKDSGAKIDQ